MDKMETAPDIFLDCLSRPVQVRLGDLADGHTVAPHRHDWGQLVYSGEGTMSVQTEQGIWLAPPRRAVWVPRGIEHSVTAHGRVRLRSIYVGVPFEDRLPASCHALSVTALLRELILAATALPIEYTPDGPAARLMVVLVDQLAQAPRAPLHLPEPRDPRLRKIAAALHRRPADGRRLEDYARDVGASARTLARRFVAETGLGFSAWRQKLRLLIAIERLGAGQPVTTVALDLGYDSPSAFIAMFKRRLGVTPKGYFARPAVSSGS